MGRTYFNHGITGNGKMLVTFTDKGEINRIFWPEPDFYQQINCISVGIKFDDSETKFLNDNVWYTEQSYDGDSAILNTLFDRYSTNNKTKVTAGLGLNIVKELVEKNQGKIEVESKVNAFTKFIITLNKKEDEK